MKKLRQIHLYLGCVFAPMLIFFAATGAVQMFGIRLGLLSDVHARGHGSLPFMVLASLMGLSVVATAGLGVGMALRTCGDRRGVVACLGFGVLLPAILLVIVHLKR